MSFHIRWVSKSAEVTDEDSLNAKLDPEFCIITLDGHSIKQFKQLVSRAMNCWDDADPELKEFADLITNNDLGVLQNYKVQTQRMNTKQNTDLYSKEDQLKIKKWINENGWEDWIMHVRNNTIHLVLKETTLP